MSPDWMLPDRMSPDWMLLLQYQTECCQTECRPIWMLPDQMSPLHECRQTQCRPINVTLWMSPIQENWCFYMTTIYMIYMNFTILQFSIPDCPGSVSDDRVLGPTVRQHSRDRLYKLLWPKSAQSKILSY
jgi:hypothetical protein